LTPTEARVLAAIDMDGLLDTISRLVAIPTDQGRETPAQEQMAEWMAQAGMNVDVWEIDFEELAAHPRFSVEIERGRSLGVVGALGRGDGSLGDTDRREGRSPARSLILNGHIDVVPAGDVSRWTVPPWQGTIRDGNLMGRGALDMKGALCCGLYAARAISDAGVELDGQLLLQSVIAEEDGGAGTLAAIQRGYTADGAVVIEPTCLSLAPAQGGALNFRIHVRGRSAHGALRTEGVSAIDGFIPIYRALQALEARRNSGVADPLFAHYEVPFPLCVGTLRAGEWASNVPESLCFEGRYGVAVGEEPAEARAMFEDAVAAAARSDPWLQRYPPEVEWWGGQFHPAATDPSDAIVRTVADAFRDIEGREPRIEGMPYGADMQLLVNVGHTPTVMFGPGDVRNAHRPDEWVPISELETVTRTLALTALRFCGHGS
ncbi:MAG: ArgE/DapE family deacylase, partial [Gammaproteobacteria bacterium]|nr:ArgE/DapE family deacylase [Gammaproteobacteria bacterium]